jgi:predicted ATPase
MLKTLAISNYRSLRDIVIPLRSLNVITGANGTGKSNLYRALRLLADVAQGRIVSSIAREGGLQSTLWAGPESISRAVRRGEFPVEPTRRKGPVSLRLGFASDEFGYAIDLGLPTLNASAFGHDPQIKRECVWHGDLVRPSALLVDRAGPLLRNRSADGTWNTVADGLSAFDSMMMHPLDPRDAPELLLLRDTIRAWRFYDYFRTDAESPVRTPQVGTWTPVLGNDGSDLASAIQTMIELDERALLSAAVEDAFPGAELSVQSEGGRLMLLMSQQGLLRPLSAAELSDGTLRYLLWIAALLSPRPPRLMVLNEPETSLHPDLLAALGRLIAQSAGRTQVVVVTHAKKLIEEIQRNPACNPIKLEKDFGETRVLGNSRSRIGLPPWKWPTR